MKMSWEIHIQSFTWIKGKRRQKGSSKGKKGDKIRRISVDNGDNKKPRGKKSRARKLMDGKRSALGSKGGPKSNRRVGKSESRRYMDYRMGTKINYDHDEGDKANRKH
jgi:hypothetical protein